MWLLISAGAHCGPSYRLPLHGVSREANHLVWTLNVGILNDADLPPIAPEIIEQALEAAADRLERNLPGIQINWILDQPMNSVFLMQQGIRNKHFMDARTNPEGPVLELGPGREAVNQRKLDAGLSRAVDRIPYRQNLQFWHSLRFSDDVPVLEDKLCTSDHVWRSYFQEQVRYDLIFTNAVVFGDHIQKSPYVSRRGLVLWNIVDAPERSGMERSGAYLSLQNLALSANARPDERIAYVSLAGDSDAARLNRAELVRELTRLMIALVYPADVRVRQSAEWERQIAAGTLLTPPNPADCAECEAYWQHRLDYLTGAALVIDGEYDEGCPAILRYQQWWQMDRHAPNNAQNSTREPSNPFLSPAPSQAARFNSALSDFAAYCGKNDDSATVHR